MNNSIEKLNDLLDGDSALRRAVFEAATPKEAYEAAKKGVPDLSPEDFVRWVQETTAEASSTSQGQMETGGSQSFSPCWVVFSPLQKSEIQWKDEFSKMMDYFRIDK